MRDLRIEDETATNGSDTGGSGRDTAAPSVGEVQRPRGQASWRSALDVVATFAMLLVAGGIVWNWYRPSNGTLARSAVSVPTKPVSLDGVPLLGDPGAKAAVLIFSDFQCPYCARFANEIMPALKERYVDRGLARVGFRHLPLAMHNRAERAAESAECASQQGQFWAMHDALFTSPARLEELDLTSDAAAIGLDRAKFATCMSHPISDRVKRDSDSAQALGFQGTPSFIVGRLEGGALHATSVLVGAQPFGVFEKALDGVLGAR